MCFSLICRKDVNLQECNFVTYNLLPEKNSLTFNLVTNYTLWTRLERSGEEFPSNLWRCSLRGTQIPYAPIAKKANYSSLAQSSTLVPLGCFVLSRSIILSFTHPSLLCVWLALKFISLSKPQIPVLPEQRSLKRGPQAAVSVLRGCVPLPVTIGILLAASTWRSYGRWNSLFMGFSTHSVWSESGSFCNVSSWLGASKTPGGHKGDSLGEATQTLGRWIIWDSWGQPRGKDKTDLQRSRSQLAWALLSQRQLQMFRSGREK